MVIEDVETVVKGGNHFSIQRIVFFHRVQNADFRPLSKRNTADCRLRGILPVIS